MGVTFVVPQMISFCACLPIFRLLLEEARKKVIKMGRHKKKLFFGKIKLLWWYLS